MKKAPKAKPDAEMAPEYDFSKGERGKYLDRSRKSKDAVFLAPDVAAAFPDSESVNDALRALIRIARRTKKKATA